MDIKTRIDGLSEQESKAALEWFMKEFRHFSIRCTCCPINFRCGNCIEPGKNDCKNLLLDEALKEARE